MERGEFFSVHVGHLVYSFAEDNMYEFEIDCLIFTITIDLDRKGNRYALNDLKFSRLPIQVVQVPLMKKTERERGKGEGC